MTDVKCNSFADVVGFDPTQLAGSLGEVHGTTVLSIRCQEGVLTLADRRATAGNLIMFDEAEKVFALDDRTVIAISGAFARSVEVCRFLRHSFQYYRRMTLNELSLEGKLQEISRTLAGNLAAMMDGIGVFIPIVAAYDHRRDRFGVYFFDGAGARFTHGGYACAGSGSERIRGVFEYLARTVAPWEERPMTEVLVEGLRMLDIAADLDSATGGFKKALPVVRMLDREGTRVVGEDEIRAAIKLV